MARSRSSMRTSCIIIDIPTYTRRTVGAVVDTLASCIHSCTNVTSFAVARHERSLENSLRLRTATCHALQFNTSNSSHGWPGNDFVTAWAELRNCGNSDLEHDMFARDDLQTRLNNLTTEFYTSTCSCAGEQFTDESTIAWSKSRQLLQHQNVKRWLDKCLQCHPCCRPTHVQAHATKTPTRCHKAAALGTTPAPVARFKSKIDRLLAINIPPLNGSNVIQWVEDKLSLRYIRLALEDGCKSCIWHPSLRAIHASNAPPTNACKAETMHCE